MAKKETKYIVIELNTRGGTKDVEKTIKRVVSDLRSYENRLKEVNKAYKAQKEVVDLISQSHAMIRKSGGIVSPEQRKVLSTQRQELNKLNKEYLRLNTNITSNKRAMNDYKASVLKTNKSQDSQADSLKAFAVQLLATVAIYQKLRQALTFTIQAYTSFEYTLMNVQTLLNETDRTLSRGSIMIMKKYGFAIEDVNKALFDSISAMIPARSAIGFLEEASRLAIGGVTDLKVAVDGLTSIINAYSLEVSEAGRVADAFFRAQKWGKTTVQDLTENIGRLAPVAAIAGVSYQEMLSTLSELTLGGLDTRESVTVLRQAIAGLIKPAAHAEVALRKYGVPVGIAEVKNAGLAYSLGKLMEAYNEFPDIVSEMIPNIRAFTGVTALTAERLQHLRMVTADVMDNWGEFSSLTSAFARQMTTTEIKVRKFRQELKTLGITMGEKYVKRPYEFMLENFRSIVVVIGALIASLGTLTIKMLVIPRIAKAITASFAMLTTAAGALTGGLSILVGVIAGIALNRSLKTKEFKHSFRTVEQQIESTTKMVGLLFDEARAANDEIAEINKQRKATTDEKELKRLNERLKELMDKKRASIEELNTNYGEYIKNIIRETAANTELTKAQEEANVAIQRNIVLRARGERSSQLQQELVEKTEPLFKKLDTFFGQKAPGKTDEARLFYQRFSELSRNFEKDVMKLYEVGEYSEEKLNELKNRLFKDTYQVYKLAFGELKFGTFGDVDIGGGAAKRSPAYFVKELIEEFSNFAKEYGYLIETLKGYNTDLVDHSNKKLREFTAGQLASEKVIPLKENESISLYDLKRIKDELPEDFDEYKKAWIEEYIDMYTELIRVIQEEGEVIGDEFIKYSAMFPRQREQSTRLTEMEAELVQQGRKINTALKDTLIHAINDYNFYTRSALDYSNKLTEEQDKDLLAARKRWWQQYRKAQLDHNRAMLNMQLSYLEDEINLHETGYEKELSLLHLSYARKVALTESGFAAQKEAIEKKMEELQMDDVDYNNKRHEFLKMIRDLEAEHNVKLLQEKQMYNDNVRKLLNRQISDLEDFKQKYIYHADDLRSLERSLAKSFEAMMNQLGDLMLTEDVINQILPGSDISLENVNKLMNSLGELSKIEFGTEGFGKFNTVIDMLKLFTNNMSLAHQVVVRFMIDAQLMREKTKASVLDSLGVLDYETSKNLQLLEHHRKLSDSRQGLIDLYIAEAKAKKGNIDLTEEETAAIEAQIDALTELSNKGKQLEIDENKLNLRRDTGNVTHGELYDIRYRKFEMQFDLGQITKEDFDNAVKVLDQEIPEWTRTFSESSFEKLKMVADRSLQIVGDVINSAFQMRAESDQREFERQMEQLTDKHNTELDLLKDRLDKGLVSEERYEKEKEKIDAKYRRREEEMKRRQFEKDKKRAISQAIIQGAVAAIKAYIDGGWLNVALVAIETAAQVALISAQKYKKGGIVGGKKHEQGGTKFFGTDGSAFEAERGELLAIVNARDTEYLNALGSLNSIHGNKFGSGGLYSDGGRFSRDIADSISGAFNYNKFVEALSNMPEPVVYVEEIQRKSDRLVKIKNAAKL